MQTKLAVVILNWNGRFVLRRFLPSVVAHSSLPGVKVIVADNHSDDDSLRILREQFPEVAVIRLERNYGFAGGYNRSLRQIEAEYYLLLNSDVEVTQGWLEPLIGYMDVHRETAACQPKLLSYNEKEKTGKDVFEYAGGCGGFLDRYGYPFCRGRIMDAVEEDKGQYDSVCSLFWATGAALMVRSSDYWNAGGLDERFFAHMEEIDFCWRLRSRGRGIACIPQSKVYHAGGGTLDKENPRKAYLNFRNNLLMLYKNLPENELKSVMRVRRVLDYLAAFSFLLKGERKTFQAVLRARRDFKLAKDSYEHARKENTSAALPGSIPERLNGCILWNYYVRGKNTFGKLFTVKDTGPDEKKHSI